MARQCCSKISCLATREHTACPQLQFGFLSSQPASADPLTPHLHLYVTLQALTGDRAGPQTAAAALEDMFSAGGGSGARKERRPCVVLVDEMDLLVNKTQVGW